MYFVRNGTLALSIYFRGTWTLRDALFQHGHSEPSSWTRHPPRPKECGIEAPYWFEQGLVAHVLHGFNMTPAESHQWFSLRLHVPKQHILRPWRGPYIFRTKVYILYIGTCRAMNPEPLNPRPWTLNPEAQTLRRSPTSSYTLRGLIP